MANRKIKHITATLTGAASSETFDIMDENASHRVENDRHYILISDSYGMRNNPSWTTIFVDNVENSVQKSVSSTGFTTSPGFIDSLSEIHDGMTEEQCNEITDIVVGGGWNDARSVSSGTTDAQLRNAIKSFCDTAVSWFPNAIISLAFMGWQVNGVVQAGTDYRGLANTRYYYNTTSHRALKHILHCEYVMMDPRNHDSSLFHPNSTSGAVGLYYAIIGGLNGGYDNYISDSISTSNVTFRSGKSATFNTFKIKGCNDSAEMMIMITVSGTFGSGDSAYLCKFNNGETPFYSNNNIQFPIFDYTNKTTYYAAIFANGDFAIYANTTLTNAVLIARFPYSRSVE